MDTRTHLPGEPSYPSALHDLGAREHRSTPVLRTRGPWPAPEGVAIVGSRDATAESLGFTRKLAAAIVGNGWAVWSGGALGVDAEAHRGAIDHGGVTVVVCPSGLGVPYPKAHEELFARVLEAGGTLVSPFEDAMKARLHHFHQRNAVLAALTFATVVVQAREKSGARSTARYARMLGRPLYAVPHAPWEEGGRGCAIEIADGAQAIVSEIALVEELRVKRTERRRGEAGGGGGEAPRARDVLVPRARDVVVPRACERAEVLAREHAHVRALQDLDEETTRVLGAISEVPIHMDDLCERAALPVGAVAVALLTLTLGAVVVEAPAGYYRRRAASI